MANVTCRTLIEEGLPNLLCSDEGLRAHGASLSSGRVFEGNVLEWVNFDNEVETFIYGSNPGRQPNSSTALFQRPGQGAAPYEQEKYLCASEKGCEGRFNQQVMHPLAQAASLHNLQVRLGDFKATHEGQGILHSEPDVACMARGGNPKQQVRFVGECKADWREIIQRDYVNANNSPNGMKDWINQISSYLRLYKLQYGFLTTYHFTIFVWFPYFSASSLAPTDSLYMSRPIPHSQAYQPGQRVSVRQVIWYLMHKASSGESNWRMTQDPGAKNTSGLRSAKAGRLGSGGGLFPPQTGGSTGTSGRQSSSGLSTGTTHSKDGKVVTADSLKKPQPGSSRDTSGRHSSSEAHSRTKYSKDVKVLNADSLKKLQPGRLQARKSKDGPVTWEMQVKEKDKPQQILYKNVKLRLDPKHNPLFVYSGEKAAYRLQASENVRGKMEKCHDTGELQKMMSQLKLQGSG